MTKYFLGHLLINPGNFLKCFSRKKPGDFISSGFAYFDEF